MIKLLIIILFTLSIFGCKDDSSIKPNIILILADDLGYNDLSCYRNTVPNQSEQPPTCETPNIDQLTEQGLRFTDFYCGAAVCSPSRAALLTGRNPTRLGIYNWIPASSPMHLRTEEITIAEMLKKDGYTTGHFGKWHLGYSENNPSPNDQGFDYSFFTELNAEPSHLNPVNFVRNGEDVGELNGYACQLVVDEALNWLDKQKDLGNPFYMNVFFQEPHTELAAPKELTDRHEYKPIYYGAIENMDLAVGKLLVYLKENNLEENTIIMFMSDNGSEETHSNDPFRGEKSFNYEGGIRTPFIIRWDKKIPAGKFSPMIGSFTDILPSIAALTGNEIPSERKLDGINLSPVFLGTQNEIKRGIPIFMYRYFHEPICMIRENEWILLGYEEEQSYSEDYDMNGTAKLKPKPGEDKWSMWDFMPSHMEALKKQKINFIELYNIKEDFEQKRNVAEKHPELVSRLKEKMLSLLQEMINEGGDWYSK